MRHRGAVAADRKTGDGAGVLLPIAPALVPGPWCGLAMVFLRDDAARAGIEAACEAEGIGLAGWRKVPVDRDALGDSAVATMPRIEQLVLVRPFGLGPDEAEARAYRARRRAERVRGAYVASLSFRTVTYKALCAADQLDAFYADLRDPTLEVPFAIFHQRFSTNTSPSWERAQPFRLLCHNGEINTLRGNIAWMRARESRLGDELPAPVLDESGSDSAMLDNAVELLTRGGRDVRHAMSMLLPPAWQNDPELDPGVRAFHRYHAGLIEPWDGPAGVVFTDGRVVGAALDRNGLRPLRYAITDDGLVACASEAGAIPLPHDARVRRGKLGPGEMLAVDAAGRGVELDEDVKRTLAARRPYLRWLAVGRRELAAGEPVLPPAGDLRPRHVLAGYTREDLTLVLRPAASNGHEPISSMGDDSALPPLAGRARPLYSFFRQRFAQVTNPPIDHLRERSVMSLQTLLGPRAPLLDRRPRGREAARARELLPLPVRTSLAPPEGSRRDVPRREPRVRLQQAVLRCRRGCPRRRGLLAARRCGDRRGAPSSPRAPRGRRSPPCPRRGGPSHLDVTRRRERRAARGAPLCLLDRIRSRRRVPAPRARDRRRPRSRGQARRCGAGRGAAELPPRGRERRPQGDGEDGHLRRRLVPRRRGVRGDRPRGRRARGVLPAHAGDRRPGRVRGARARCSRAARGRALGGAGAREPRVREVPQGRRASCDEPRGRRRAAAGRGPQASLGGERHGLGRLRTVRAARQRARAPRAARPARARSRRRAGSARAGRARRVDPAPLLERRHVARLALGRGARDGGDRLQPARRPLELGRRRRGSRALRRRAELPHQADRLGALRCHRALRGLRRRAPDQDRAGLEARRGRPAAGAQGQRGDRAPAPHAAGHRADLAAAASRHLLDRGPRAARLRPEAGEPGRGRLGQARLRGRRRPGRRRCREGARRRRARRRSGRRDRRQPTCRRSRTRVRRGSSGSPRRSGRSSPKVCEAESASASTAG